MLHGVKSMIGSTTMLVQMLLFVTFVCKMNMKKKFLASKKHEPAFITNGYTYLKEATTAFNQHQWSATHLEAIEAFVLLSSQIQGGIGVMKC